MCVPNEVFECRSLTPCPPLALWFFLRDSAQQGGFSMPAELTAKRSAQRLTLGKHSRNALGVSPVAVNHPARPGAPATCQALGQALSTRSSDRGKNRKTTCLRRRAPVSNLCLGEGASAAVISCLEMHGSPVPLRVRSVPMATCQHSMLPWELNTGPRASRSLREQKGIGTCSSLGRKDLVGSL